MVNILCHKALMAAYGRGDTRITRTLVRLAAADTDGVRSVLQRARAALRGLAA